jgi:pimeloyl-ACP methyl ester carboxylesterase
MTIAPRSHTVACVTSADGTTIGYRRFGSGPGCVLLHGALQASQNLTDLAAALADRFTVYVPDRRGRGLSGPAGDGHGIHTECQDVAAVMAQNQIRRVFGLSSGAIVALDTALTVPTVEQVAIYEPPLTIEHPPRWMARYRAEIARNSLASALVTVLKGTQTAPPLLHVLPRFVLTPVMRLAIAADAHRTPDGSVPLRDLIPTMRFEPRPAAPDAIGSYAAITADVLLLGGARSPHYLRHDLDNLETALPHATRIEFPGLDHSGPDNRGNPGAVATALATLFAS